MGQLLGRITKARKGVIQSSSKYLHFLRDREIFVKPYQYSVPRVDLGQAYRTNTKKSAAV